MKAIRNKKKHERDEVSLVVRNGNMEMKLKLESSFILN